MYQKSKVIWPFFIHRLWGVLVDLYLLVTIEGCVYRIRAHKPNRRQEPEHWPSLLTVCIWYWNRHLFFILFLFDVRLFWMLKMHFFHYCFSETCRMYESIFLLENVIHVNYRFPRWKISFLVEEGLGGQDHLMLYTYIYLCSKIRFSTDFTDKHVSFV